MIAVFCIAFITALAIYFIWGMYREANSVNIWSKKYYGVAKKYYDLIDHISSFTQPRDKNGRFKSK